MEDLLAVRKMQGLDAEIKSGKRKLLSEKEALAKYKTELGLKSSSQ